MQLLSPRPEALGPLHHVVDSRIFEQREGAGPQSRTSAMLASRYHRDGHAFIAAEPAALLGINLDGAA